MHEKLKKEYDFSKMKGGVRGKYYKAYFEGHTVKIHKMDGTTVVQHFTLEDGAVMLEPDVREYFPNSEFYVSQLHWVLTGKINMAVLSNLYKIC